MQEKLDWNRYAVVHWRETSSPRSNEYHSGSQTRAFAGLGEAVLFIVMRGLRDQQTLRISCGGMTYHYAGIKALAEHPEFPLELADT